MDQEQPQKQVLEEMDAFFEGWHRSHKHHIDLLQQALRSHDPSSDGPDHLVSLVRRSLDDYRDYYDAKRRAVRQDAFHVLSPIWKSALEIAFMWMGGWRPSAVFQVALSQTHQPLPPEDLRASPVVLSGLSAQQLRSVEAEKERVRAVEEEISRKASLLQKSIADRSVVRFAQSVEVIDATIAFAQLIELKGVMGDKVEQLCDLLLQADALRLASLEAMISILSPLQAAQYLVTAEVLKLAFSHVGEIKDRKAAAAEGGD